MGCGVNATFFVCGSRCRRRSRSIKTRNPIFAKIQNRKNEKFEIAKKSKCGIAKISPIFKRNEIVIESTTKLTERRATERRQQFARSIFSAGTWWRLMSAKELQSCLWAILSFPLDMNSISLLFCSTFCQLSVHHQDS
jgi:hypothetical protein